MRVEGVRGSSGTGCAPDGPLGWQGSSSLRPGGWLQSVSLEKLMKPGVCVVFCVYILLYNK